MHRRLAVLSTVLLCLVGVLPGRSQQRQPNVESSRSFYIQGSLRKYDGNQPVEQIRVDLKKLTGEVVATAFTGSNGEFTFGGLSPGSYYVVVEEKGYEPISEHVVLFTAPRSGLYLFLKRPLEFGTTSEPGSTVSAHELSLPSKARDAMQKGMERLYEKKDFKGSLAEFQRAIKEAPAYYEAYERMALAYMNLGQMAQAEEAFRKSVELSQSRYAEALFGLASLLSDNRRYAEAEPFAHKGVEVDSNAWQGHFELARVLLGLNQVEAAGKSAEEARAHNASFPPLHLLLANIHIRKHDYPAVMEDLDAYLKLEPNGASSQQARETREKIKAYLAKAQNVPAAAPPKP
jgi:Tfp pilus assembly protein PilF